MAITTTTITNTSGSTAYFHYIPPNGKSLANSASVTIPGDLGTFLALTSADRLAEYEADIISNDIDSTVLVPEVTTAITASDKNLEPTSSGASNYHTTGITISHTPSGDGYVVVLVNGLANVLKGDRTGAFYFSADAGTTARAIANITVGDTLYFNAAIAGFQLYNDADGPGGVGDRISLVYDA